MNLVFDLKFRKLNDLCDQVFDYFHLTYYDLESKIDNELNINNIKSKFETFADKHFKSAIEDFKQEIQFFKYKSPIELIKLEKISDEIHRNFEQLIKNNLFDIEVISQLKIKAKENLIKLKEI
tara:strand:+ start:49 stop:417 length:369 start_codon:yes stop_codon:yes gene_type:complete